MADIDPNSIPFVPSTDVSLIDTSTGKPKTAFHDWMSAIFDWMKRSVVDLTTKVTTLIDGQGDLQAALVVEQIARVDGDTALAAQITTVDAKANSATANGQVVLAAKAGPGGSIAAFGTYLTANSAFTGFEMVAKSDGTSAIGLTAAQFYLVDSGTMQQALAYNGSAFVFQVPIVIQSGTSGARKVSTEENDKIYDSSGTLRVAVGINI